MEKVEVWQGNKEKHLAKNPLIRFLDNKLKRDVLRILNKSGQSINEILDMGCGEGFVTFEIAKKFSNSKVVAIDPERSYVEYAKKFNSLKNINYQKKDLDSLNHNKKFDLVILIEVLEHLPNPKKSLKKILSLSNKYVLFSVPNEPFFRMGNLLALKYIDRLGNTPGHLNNWTKSQVSRFLEELGLNFKIKTSTFWNIVLIEV